MLQLTDVNTYYGKSHVLFGISMEVRKGEIVGLFRAKRRRQDNYPENHYRPYASGNRLDTRTGTGDYREKTGTR